LVSESTSRGLVAGLPLAARLRPATSRATLSRWAAVSSALTPLVMIGAWLVAEALQPPSYSPLHSSISGLAALGATDRWIVTSALIVVGACYLVTAGCLPGLRRSARVVLLIAGISSIGIAFSPQPVEGSSAMHLVWTCLGAAAITIWPAFTASRAPSPPLILRARGVVVVTAVFLVLSAWLVAETQHGSALGLTERLVSGIQITWPFVVALTLQKAQGREGKIKFRLSNGRLRCAAINRQILLPGSPVPSADPSTEEVPGHSR
jgi:hypothetical membrane protein